LRRFNFTRVTAALAAGVLLSAGLTGCGGGAGAGDTTSEQVVKVGIAYDVGGRGDKSFNDSAYLGLQRVQKELKLEINDVDAKQGESDADKVNRLTLMAKGGFNPIIGIGFAYSAAVEEVAKKFPKLHFAVVDGTPSKAPNVTALTFSEEQGSFLVGAAGAEKVNPDIKVLSKYMGNTPDAFNEPAKARVAAQGQYDAGADVIYGAAGRSNLGVFEASAAKKKFSIGVDADQWQTAKPEEKPYIMTSMLKRVDTAVFDFVKAAQTGKPKIGEWKFELAADGVGYAQSNGQAISDVKEKVEGYKKDIVDGKITVPTEVK
jgi:basic membrane protein A